MYQTPEQLVAFNKANLEAAVRFAGIALEGAERLHRSSTEGRERRVCRQRATSQGASPSQRPVKSSCRSRTLSQAARLEKTAELREELLRRCRPRPRPSSTSWSKSSVGEFNKQVVTALDKMVKTAPAGSEVAVAAVKSAISGVNSTYDNIAKSAKQFVDMTQANVEAWRPPGDQPEQEKSRLISTASQQLKKPGLAPGFFRLAGPR